MTGAIHIGPSWSRDETGEFRLPRFTLGWEAIRWASVWLRQPDGPDSGKPWRFTPEQARIVLHWYEINEYGKFVYPYGLIQRMKGAGKDPLGAVICLIEFIGPCRFADWSPEGTPIVVPHSAPWVQVAGVNQDATKNTMTLFSGLLSDEARQAYGIDEGKTLIHSAAGGRLEAVTASPRALEGGRSTFILKGESHHWLASNQGLAMAEVIDRNAVKSRDGSSRALAITNAHVPGENSDAERDWNAYQDYLAGRTVSDRPPFMLDALSASPDTDLRDDDSLREGIRQARGDATWLDVERILEAIRDPRIPPSVSRRFYLNQVVADEDSFLTAYEWDSCFGEDVAPVSPEDPIVMFFDGSKNDDSTALVGCRISDGHVFMLAGWDKPAGPLGLDWEIDKNDVDRVVRKTLDEMNVKAFFGDVLGFEGLHDGWAADYGDQFVLWASDGRYKHATAWDMRTKTKDFTLAVERFHEDVTSKALTHDGDPGLRQHILNARRRPNRYGVSIGKESRESDRKIDRAVCAIGARMVRNLVIQSRAHRQEKKKVPGVLIGF